MMRYYNPFIVGDIIEVIIALAIVGSVGYLLITLSNKKENFSDILGTKKALNILAERYAKGEISDSEYEHKKTILKNKYKNTYKSLNKKTENIQENFSYSGVDTKSTAKINDEVIIVPTTNTIK